ncbi:MAG: aminotransferase class V-fold PLP-dependent enzyme [Sciscionella sp.]
MGDSLACTGARQRPVSLKRSTGRSQPTSTPCCSTGALWDAPATTTRIHDRGALVLWDLCHSTGALPVDLHAWDADLAVGCGYKFLNGGLGAPAYCYVARRHHGGLRTPLPGWHGHAEPFAMRQDYQPGSGANQLSGGTPPVLSLLALEEGVASFDGVEMNSLRGKGKQLTTLFADLVALRCPELALSRAGRGR